jgi:hypothetical protein
MQRTVVEGGGGIFLFFMYTELLELVVALPLKGRGSWGAQVELLADPQSYPECGKLL